MILKLLSPKVLLNGKLCVLQSLSVLFLLLKNLTFENFVVKIDIWFYLCYYNVIIDYNVEFKVKTKRVKIMKYVLYNPLSGHGDSCSIAKNFSESSCDSRLIDMTEIPSVKDFCVGLAREDEIYLFGGDGTINRFVNALDGLEIENSVYYYPSGTGNDFCIDVDKKEVTEPFLLNGYIKNLPSVTVDGKRYRFINGVGYGIDGYCCQVGDALKEKGKAPNYTAIAIKGLLFKFKPVNATVTVDGVKTEFKKVWIAPTMFGRHYGGGMIPTPEQDRYEEDGNLSLMVFHGSSKMRTLMIFPSIFKGEHVKNTKYVTVMKGKEITVEFDRPTPLQIDGETLIGVTKYTAVAKSKVKTIV